jgi:hypothetical protein
MNKIFDLSKLTTAELQAVKSALVGEVATGGLETKAGKEARKLRAENAELKKLSKRRDIVEDNELGWDDGDLWTNLSDEEFDKTVELMIKAKKQGASAEKEGHTLRVPPVYGEPYESPRDTIRNFLRARKEKSEV